MPLPLHGNVGESAMVLGAFALLEELGWPSPTVISDIETFDPALIAKRLGGGPIVIGGGGNFGDLWPREHAIRLRILRELRSNAVIQLPQSVHFGSDTTREETADAVAGHPKVTLLIRDRRSLRVAESAFPEAEPILCTDMAFALGTLRRGEATTDVVRLIRRDHESRYGPESEESATGVDWVAEPPAPPIRAERTLRNLGLRWPWAVRLTNRLRQTLHKPMARTRLDRGLALLSSGRAFVTDRLHAHILGLMLGVPHAIVADRNGKTEGFVETWTDGLPGFRLAGSFDEAEKAVREFLQGAAS